ncbi:DUF4198 domain-containing protein [Gloeobacter kilaueensis]|nr:DUF4198 domain-containing protein [Gloeobacter kilaueensis]
MGISKNRQRIRNATRAKSVAACLVLTGGLLTAAPAWSHDYWLMPEKLTAVPGEPIKVHLYYGDDFKIENERPFQKDRTPRFQLSSATGGRDLGATAKDGQLPLVDLRLDTPGTYLISLDRNAQNIVLQPKEFEAYLSEEGLNDILVLRRKLGKAQSPGRERYARSIKSIIQLGTVFNDDVAGRTLGQTIEIVPEQNPARLRSGENLSVRIRFAGQPLVDQQINAFGPNRRLAARTDRAGRATFRLDEPGAWIVRLVHMRPCTSDCGATDWESFWSSITFAIAGS